MIIDSFENVSAYEGMHPRFPAAFAYLKELLAKNVPDGRYEPDQSGEYYVSIGTGALKNNELARAESHRKYIDLQLVLEGTEHMYIPSANPLPAPESEFNVEKDCVHYDSVPKSDCHCLNVTEGQFAIFFAGELHAPSMAPTNEPCSTRKVVLKIMA